MNNKTIDLPAWAYQDLLGIHVDEENHPQLATFLEAGGFLDEQNRHDFGDDYERWGEDATRVYFLPLFDDNDDEQNLVLVCDDMMNSFTVHKDMLQAIDSLVHDGFYESKHCVPRQDDEDKQTHMYKYVLRFLRRCERSHVLSGFKEVAKRLASEFEIDENE